MRWPGTLALRVPRGLNHGTGFERNLGHGSFIDQQFRHVPPDFPAEKFEAVYKKLRGAYSGRIRHEVTRRPKNNGLLEE